MNKTSLTYNRQTRKWEITGEIGELLDQFPAGPQGRRDAVVEQLKIEVPEAAAVALDLEQRISRLNGRAIRAAQLLMQDKAVIPADPNRWAVIANDGRNRYTVHQLFGATWRWHCNCADWALGEENIPNGAPWLKQGEQRSPTCKHILAVLISQRIGAPQVPAWPPICPECGKSMHVKRQRNNGSGLPFWSCANFPHCDGRRDFQPHPDDLAAESGNGQRALFRSMERAQEAGLVAVAAGAKRDARQRELEARRARMAYEDLGQSPPYAL